MTDRRARLDLLIPAAVCALQLLISLPRLNLPFVEGRAHWVNDDAYFLQMALHSNDRTVESPWKVFGLAQYRFGRCAQVEALEHYSHHPVLASTLFRAYTRLAGYRDWVPRSFALLISLLGTLLLYRLVREAASEPWLGGAAALLHALLPLNYMYQDSFKHEGLAVAVALSSLLLYLRLESGRATRGLFLAALFALFHAEWAVYPFGAGLLFLLWRRAAASPALRPCARAALAAAAAGAASSFAVLYGLGFDAEHMVRQFRYRAAAGLAELGLAGWLRAQLANFEMNFGLTALAALVGLLLYAAASRGRKAHPLTAFGLLFLLTGTLWVGTFRNLSLVHHYSQWYLGTALVLLFAGAAASARERHGWGDEAFKRLALAGFVPLLALSVRGALELEERVLPSEGFALPEDVRLLRGQTRRLVAASNGLSGPKDWWRSTSVRLYSDPIYKAVVEGLPRAEVCGGMSFLEDAQALDPATDLVVSRAHPGAVSQVRKEVRERFGGMGLTVQSRSPTFAFLAPKAAEPKGAK